jgi:hypothetical protein
MTDAEGLASTTFIPSQAGSFEVSVYEVGNHLVSDTLAPITIAEAPLTVQTKIDISGPTTGEEDKALTYNARLTTTATGLPINGAALDFTVYDEMNIVNTQRAITNQDGQASASFTIQQPGSYHVVARVVGNANVVNHLDITITKAGDGGGGSTGGNSGQTGGDATSAKTTNTSVAGIEDIAAQAEAATGLGSNALLIVLGIAGIILLALIAGVLLIGRGRGEDEYEYEGEEPYKRE